jgi:hypothetical protein
LVFELNLAIFKEKVKIFKILTKIMLILGKKSSVFCIFLKEIIGNLSIYKNIDIMEIRGLV